MSSQPTWRRWQLVISLLVSATFVWIAARSLNLEQVSASLDDLSYGWLVPATGAYFLTVAARAWRWAYLLRPLKPVPARRLLPVVAIGYLGNNIYPFRIGEFIRAYLLKRWEAISVSSSLATILVERIFDGVAVLTFVFVTLPFIPFPGSMLRSLLLLVSGGFLGTLLVLLFLASQPHSALRLLDVVLRYVPLPLREPANGLSRRFLEGLASLRDWRQVVILLASSIAIWLLETVKYGLVLLAFPFALDFLSLMFMNGVINLATILPSAPGFVGTFDTPGIAVLILYGVAEGPAGAYILVLHAVLWLSSVLFGFLFMIRMGLRWSDLTRAAQMEK